MNEHNTDQNSKPCNSPRNRCFCTICIFDKFTKPDWKLSDIQVNKIRLDLFNSNLTCMLKLLFLRPTVFNRDVAFSSKSKNCFFSFQSTRSVGWINTLLYTVSIFTCLIGLLRTIFFQLRSSFSGSEDNIDL